MSKLPQRRSKNTERNYLAAVVQRITTDDIDDVVKAVLEDAKSGDVKIRAAAREWLGKYVLGGGSMRLGDIDDPPVITRRK